MPDNPNENKFMAMLERRGIVRKVGSADDTDDVNTADDNTRTDTDFRSILGQPASDGPKITPAPRQPVPGMITPVMPGSQPQTVSPAKPLPEKAPEPSRTIPVNQTEPELFQSVKPPEPDRPQPVKPSEPDRPQPVKPIEPERPKPIAPPQPERLKPVEIPKPLPVSGGYSSAAEAPSRVEELFASSVTIEKPPEPQAENYTDRYLEVNELYEALSIRSRRTDSIYLVEEYLRTLPDSLPDESRREIVTKIIAASGFDFDRLMGDGVLRVKMLKEYAERFALYTEDYVNARNAELDELEQQTIRIRTLIEGRRELHKKQFFTIEAEAQRLKEILTFISG